MVEPTNRQLVLVTLKNGEIEIARYYTESVTYNGLPAYELPGRILTVDEVVKWRPLSKQEIRAYNLDDLGQAEAGRKQ